MIMGVFLIAVVVVIVMIKIFRYNQTAYYAATKKPYFSVIFEKGSHGEYLIYKDLQFFEKEGAKFLFNCYLPKENGKTSEIDVMLIHKSGIYVFESKNYSGWIFGSENSKTWTQTLPNGQKSRKEHFVNPISQNEGHIRCLEKLIGGECPIYSIIVFSERCTLKKVDFQKQNVRVIKRNDLVPTLYTMKTSTSDLLSQDQIIDLYDKLYPYTQVSEDVKRKHIDDIRSMGTVKRENYIVSNNNIIEMNQRRIYDKSNKCPKCGGNLVIRTAKKGEYAGKEFYGCEQFPKCRYIKNL